jgi:hypothetical protein
MARWTKNNAEAVRVTMLGGQVSAEGVVRNMSVGNNGGSGGHWSYYGSLSIQLRGGEMVEVDFLDTDSIQDVTSQLKTEFEQLGLIKFV